jgi:hypothetical protein
MPWALAANVNNRRNEKELICFQLLFYMQEFKVIDFKLMLYMKNNVLLENKTSKHFSHKKELMNTQLLNLL